MRSVAILIDHDTTSRPPSIGPEGRLRIDPAAVDASVGDGVVGGETAPGDDAGGTTGSGPAGTGTAGGTGRTDTTSPAASTGPEQPVGLDFTNPQFADDGGDGYTFATANDARREAFSKLTTGDYVFFCVPLRYRGEDLPRRFWIHPKRAPYVIGRFRLARPLVTSDKEQLLTRRDREWIAANPAMDELPSAGAVLVGDPEESGLYRRPVPLSRPVYRAGGGVLPNRVVSELSLGDRRPGGAPLRFDAAGTSELLAIAETDAYERTVATTSPGRGESFARSLVQPPAFFELWHFLDERSLDTPAQVLTTFAYVVGGHNTAVARAVLGEGRPHEARTLEDAVDNPAVWSALEEAYEPLLSGSSVGGSTLETRRETLWRAAESLVADDDQPYDAAAPALAASLMDAFRSMRDLAEAVGTGPSFRAFLLALRGQDRAFYRTRELLIDAGDGGVRTVDCRTATDWLLALVRTLDVTWLAPSGPDVTVLDDPAVLAGLDALLPGDVENRLRVARWSLLADLDGYARSVGGVDPALASLAVEESLRRIGTAGTASDGEEAAEAGKERSSVDLVG